MGVLDLDPVASAARAAAEKIARGEGTANDHHAVAVHSYRRGDWTAALENARKALALGARGGQTRYLIGLIHCEEGRLDEGALSLEEAVAVAQRDSVRAKALSALGAVRCLQGSPRAALDPLARACELRPDLREARHNLGVAAVRAHEWEVAADAFARLAQEEPAPRARASYLKLLVDVGRAAALDEMRAQGHKLKNLIGLAGDKARQLPQEGPARELARDLEELFSGMKNYLDAMKEEPLDFDLVDVNALVARCLFALSPSFADLKVERKLGPDLPEVVADRSSLEEAFTNVVRNAIEALRQVPPAPASGGAGDEPHLEVSTRSADGGVAIDVRDRGPGLDPEDLDRIFRLGFTTKPRGSGIGLTQVRKLVRAHGGDVQVTGAKGAGACFTILLPTSPPPEPSLPRLDVRSPLFESLGDLVLGQPESVDSTT